MRQRRSIFSVPQSPYLHQIHDSHLTRSKVVECLMIPHVACVTLIRIVPLIVVSTNRIIFTRYTLPIIMHSIGLPSKIFLTVITGWAHSTSAFINNFSEIKVFDSIADILTFSSTALVSTVCQIEFPLEMVVTVSLTLASALAYITLPWGLEKMNRPWQSPFLLIKPLSKPIWASLVLKLRPTSFCWLPTKLKTICLALAWELLPLAHLPMFSLFGFDVLVLLGSLTDATGCVLVAFLFPSLLLCSTPPP